MLKDKLDANKLLIAKMETMATQPSVQEKLREAAKISDRLYDLLTAKDFEQVGELMDQQNSLLEDLVLLLTPNVKPQ